MATADIAYPSDLWRMDAAGGNEVRLTQTEGRDEYSRSWQTLQGRLVMKPYVGCQVD